MTKAIFFDVDGTLVSFKTHQISPAVRQALQALRERGIKLFLSTGRHLAMLDPVRQVFDFDGYVTLSGQYCTAQGQVLRSTPMPPEAVEELVAAARTDAFSCIFLEGEEIYINCINEMTRQFIRDLSTPMPLQRPADYARGREVYQAVTFLTREREHLLLDRAPHLKTTGGWTRFWTTSASRWRTLWLSETGKTTCPCCSTRASGWPWGAPTRR